MNSVLFKGRLMHHRFQPKVHRFSYRVVSWLFDLDEFKLLNQQYRWFSRNRFNLFSFYDRDYGDRSGTSLKQQVNRLLAEHRMVQAEKIYLLCYPRVLGYVFNPLSVYYCLSDDQLSAIVYEVSNTFGERHSYVIEASSNSIQEMPEQVSGQQSADKQMHVSPFFERDCFYRFEAPLPDDSLKLNIELHKNSERLFIASLAGRREPLTDKALLRAFTAIPFQTIKVMVTIHWQALKLWLKGISVVRHVPLKNNYSSSKGKLSSEPERSSMEIEPTVEIKS